MLLAAWNLSREKARGEKREKTEYLYFATDAQSDARPAKSQCFSRGGGERGFGDDGRCASPEEGERLPQQKSGKT